MLNLIYEVVIFVLNLLFLVSHIDVFYTYMSNRGSERILIINRLYHERLTALPLINPVDFQGWQNRSLVRAYD